MDGLDAERERPLSVAVVATDEASLSSVASLQHLLMERWGDAGGWTLVADHSRGSDVLILMGQKGGAAEAIRQWATASGGEARPSTGGGTGERLLVSAIDGLRFADLRASAGPGPVCCRATVGGGALAEAGLLLATVEPEAPEERRDLCLDLLRCFGDVELVSEETFEVAEALISAMPHLLCEVLLGMELGAVETGLPSHIARPLLRQTLLVTSLLLERDPVSPAELKDQVASPGGTTIAGLAVLEDGAVRGALLRALEEVALVRGK